MPLRKRINRENTEIFGESQQEVSETQEDDAHTEKDEVSSLAAAREVRKREKQKQKLKPKGAEMTEEEMMDLALRLSEQEANVTARRLQEEEEAVRRAIQDSMLNESQNLMDDAPLCISSRRKLVYSNGESQTVTTDRCTQGGGQRATGHITRSKKRRRAEGSPLMEMPELSQTKSSPSSSESIALGSPQSCDSTQIENCDLPKSPVFPSSSSAQVQVSVHVPRLDQSLLDLCATSGFVLCSQDSTVPTQNSHVHQHIRSPTFPKNPALCSKKPISSSKNTHSQPETLDLGDGMTPNQNSALCKSPVFGQTDSKSALKSETSEATALEFSSQESSMSFCLEKDVSLIKSPVFSKTQRGLDGVAESGRKSPVFGTNKETERTCEDDVEDKNAKENTSNLSERELTCDMMLRWSDDDEDNTTPVVSPSPVFPEERSVPQKDNQTVRENQESSQTKKHCRATGPQAQTASETPGFSGDSTAQPTVHYYWGVPFCPRGLDPNDYTKVIVAQLEVYEKSLKQAQRSLLNKLTWGEPILPQREKSPSPESNSPQIHLQTRRSRRRKGKLKEAESDEELEEMDEETQRSHRKEEEEGDKSAGEEAVKGTEEEPRNEQAPLEEDLNEDETQVESDCEVCPETQLSDNDHTQELTLPSQQPIRSPEIETVQVDSPNVAEPDQAKHEELMEMGTESQAEPKVLAEQTHSKPADVDLGHHSLESQFKEDAGPQRSESPDLDSDKAPGPEGPVQCPICQQAFPSDQIEMHAAFCDGEAAAGERASPKLRRKRTKRGEADDNDHTDTEPGVAQEKCYICHKVMSIRDYSRHTERCFQRRASRTAATGGLLSALDQSEQKNPKAGPSGSTVQPQEVIDLIDDDEEEDSVSLIRVSNSPIRSFTSISEAQDCLIDFRTQYCGKKPRPRRGTKPATKRR